MPTNRDLILDFVRRYPGRNDDEIAQALGISPRQTANMICRQLEKEGQLERRKSGTTKIANFPRIPGSDRIESPLTTRPGNASAVAHDVTEDWFWEGNIVDVLAAFLLQAGWTIASQADTRRRERGIDISALKGGISMLVEAKGFPSTRYRDAARAQEVKPTRPSQQALHWFSHALLKAVRLQGQYPSAHIAMAFPAHAKYYALFEESRTALEKLNLTVFFINEEGSVEVKFWDTMKEFLR